MGCSDIELEAGTEADTDEDEDGLVGILSNEMGLENETFRGFGEAEKE